MKKLIILCSVVFLFASVTAFKVEEKAEFKFEKETHDFGKIPARKGRNHPNPLSDKELKILEKIVFSRDLPFPSCPIHI